MKKASEVLLIISGVISIIWGVGYLIAGIVMFVFTTPQAKQMLLEGLNNGTVYSNLPGTPEQQVATIQYIFLIIGIIMLVCLAFAIANTVLSFVAKGKKNTVLYVLVIVFSLLSGTFFGLIGSIFGLVTKDDPVQQ